MAYNFRYNEEDDVIDVLELAQVLLRHWFLLLFCFTIGAVLMAGVAYMQPLTYTSSSSIFIKSEETTLSSLAQIQLGNALSKDFEELATSKPVLDAAKKYVEDATGIELTRDDIQYSTWIYNNEGTRLLRFTTTTQDPVLSQAIAQSLARATAEQVSKIMNVDEPRMVDIAELGEVNGRGLKRGAALGGIVGFMIPAVFFLLQFLFNVKITNEEDVRKYLHTQVVGIISLDKTSSYNKKRK